MLAESRLYQQWMAEKECETKQAAIVSVLEARFETVPEEVATLVRSVSDLTKLEAAIKLAVRCKDFADFRKRFKR